MDDTTATTPSPSSAATTAAGYDAARDKTNVGVAATAAASSSSIRLLIKSSNQQYDDMNIESDLCWTVQRLKKQLSLVYPGKPAIIDQKLIYSGKLLEDAQKLSEVIRSYKDVYQQHHIFHLVCATKNITRAPINATVPPRDNMNLPRQDPINNSNTNDNELRQRHAAAAAAVAAAAQFPYQPPQLPTNVGNPWMQFLQRPPPQLPNPLNPMTNAEAASTSTSASAAAAAAAAAATSSHLEFQQQQAMLYNAWIQQWYAAYMQQMMQRNTDNATATPMTLHYLQNYGQPVAPPAAAAGAAQPNVAAPAAQQPVGRQLAAPNFPNIQEEPEMRDWLDSFFSFTRLAIFVTVLYFNSSPLRCLLVVLIASAIYLYHIGVLRRRREHNNNNINRNNNAGNGAEAFAAVQQIQRMMDAAVEHDNNPQAAAEPVPLAAQNAAAPAAAPGAAPDAAAAAAPASAGLDQADAATAAAEAVVVEPANANNSVISIVRTFVITFFTSLLPEAPAL